MEKPKILLDHTFFAKSSAIVNEVNSITHYLPNMESSEYFDLWANNFKYKTGGDIIETNGTLFLEFQTPEDYTKFILKFQS